MFELDTHLQELMAQNHIPALTLLIQQGDTRIYEGYHGHADLEHRVPVTPHTIFEIASITKLFTAQAILHLAERGTLSLDAPLIESLPALPDAWRSVTPRHCLMHQSGLPSYTDQAAYWTMTRRDKTHEEVLALVDHLPLMFAPRERYHYDNTGFYLLGMLLEAVTGEAYGDLLARLIFTPLGMAHTRANDYRALVPHRARGYRYENDALTNKPYYSISNTFSAGVLLSNGDDLLRWMRSCDDDSLLSADMRRAWWTPTLSQAQNELSMDLRVGLGWFLVDSPRGPFWGHNGGIAGFASALIHFPQERITAVVLCSADHVSAPHSIALDALKLLKL